MAELSDAVVLCKFESTSTKAYNGLVTDLAVLSTDQRVTVYNIEDCQLLYSWFVKSGRNMTSAAVQMPNSQQFSVILDNSIIQSWKESDSSIDQKSHKIKQSKPALQLFPVKDGSCVVLNEDATVAFSSDPETFWGTAVKYRSLIWCGSCVHGSDTTVVAIFEAHNSDRHVVKYTLTTGKDSFQSVDSHILPSPSGSLVAGYCLQSDKDLFLITLFSNGRVNRTALCHRSSGLSLENSLDFNLDQSVSKSQYVDVVALDNLQLAVVRQHLNTAFVEVWDVKYNAKHSESKVDLSRQGKIQHLRHHAKALLLNCEKGAFVIPYQLHPITLLRAMNSRNSLAAKLKENCEMTGTMQKDLIQTLSKLSDQSQTPVYASFKKEFVKLSSWLGNCESSPEVGLFALPLVDAVIRRVCGDKTFWPVDELRRFIKAGLLSNSMCQSLFECIVEHRQFDLLLLCLTCVRDVPESVIVVALDCVLRKENAEMLEKFDCNKEQILNLVLCLPYNECFLMEFIWKLEFALVVELVQYLYGLWNSNKVSNFQVCQWMYILLGSHLQQFNMFSECDSHLSNFIKKVNDEISSWLKMNTGSEVNVDEAKLKAIQQSGQRSHRYYITSFVHPFDD